MEAEKRKVILESAGVIFDKGLNFDEIRIIEKRYGFIFPPDLRDFLMYALPVSKGWVDWRNGDESQIRNRLLWPYDGMCFDIKDNVYWPKDWGTKPASLEEQFAIAKQKLDRAPKLIPICSHRYIPDRPNSAGNPVFSVYQTDVIYYGTDLQNYLENEFHYYFKTPEFNVKGLIREIEFWSNLADSDE